MTITKALRKLYKVIVGEEAPANANTITKVLLALAEAWTGSGGGSGGSGGGDPGYSCTETTTLLTDETVTSVANDDMNFGPLAYSTPIDADTIIVTFNGTEYVCDAKDALMVKFYGAPNREDGIDWSEYPFQIISGLNNSLHTESAGTYQIKIEAVEESVETSECFKKAVGSVTSLIVTPVDTLGVATMSETWQTIHDALAKGIHVVFNDGKSVYAITSAINKSTADTSYYSVLLTSIVNDAPTVKKYLAHSADGYPKLTV